MMEHDRSSSISLMKEITNRIKRNRMGSSAKISIHLLFEADAIS